jgi:hypothetical protein
MSATVGRRESNGKQFGGSRVGEGEDRGRRQERANERGGHIYPFPREGRSNLEVQFSTDLSVQSWDTGPSWLNRKLAEKAGAVSSRWGQFQEHQSRPHFWAGVLRYRRSGGWDKGWGRDGSDPKARDLLSLHSSLVIVSGLTWSGWGD